MLDELAALLMFVADLNNLADIVARAEVVGGQTLYLLWPGGAPHQGLTIGPNLVYNLANLRFKAHVQHAIGLVEYEVGDTAKIGLFGLKHVDETARSGNDNLDATLQISNLRAPRHAAVNTRVLDP
ncbi:hypothetical protein BC937DRAFT_92853 [Endogone sp. FLAS-F59071]|nr:hypothetical protein BC937DRAFT_92853 [Endogone sp. FLAS-F59071]|eukprot:RUS15138.1 hypothetical protein BC937DRAFT_92853 [Endogone sp. FLAS-F59071]